MAVQAMRYRKDNLREILDFVGKHPRFDEWFPTWEDYECHVTEDGYLFKIFDADCVHHASPGDWVVRLDIGVHDVFSPSNFDDYRLPHWEIING